MNKNQSNLVKDYTQNSNLVNSFIAKLHVIDVGQYTFNLLIFNYFNHLIGSIFLS